MQVYLDIQNPLHLQLDSFKQHKTQVLAKELGIDLPDKITPELSKAFSKSLVDAGYDGVILDYSPTGYNAKEVLVFATHQIRNDPDNPNITESRMLDCKHNPEDKRGDLDGDND